MGVLGHGTESISSGKKIPLVLQYNIKEKKMATLSSWRKYVIPSSTSGILTLGIRV